jgi:hypothetical protein
MMRTVGVSAVTVAVTAVAMAQGTSPFNTTDCPEQPVYQWCPSKASAAGWRVKYQNRSPANMADGSWLTEVWVRGHEAMLCEFSMGRASVLVNFCSTLQEVGQ